MSRFLFRSIAVLTAATCAALSLADPAADATDVKVASISSNFFGVPRSVINDLGQVAFNDGSSVYVSDQLGLRLVAQPGSVTTGKPLTADALLSLIGPSQVAVLGSYTQGPNDPGVGIFSGTGRPFLKLSPLFTIDQNDVLVTAGPYDIKQNGAFAVLVSRGPTFSKLLYYGLPGSVSSVAWPPAGTLFPVIDELRADLNGNVFINASNAAHTAGVVYKLSAGGALVTYWPNEVYGLQAGNNAVVGSAIDFASATGPNPVAGPLTVRSSFGTSVRDTGHGYQFVTDEASINSQGVCLGIGTDPVLGSEIVQSYSQSTEQVLFSAAPNAFGSAINDPMINEINAAAYTYQPDAGLAELHMAFAGQETSVLQIGQPLFGSSLATFYVADGQYFNRRNEAVVDYQLQDGTYGVMVVRLNTPILYGGTPTSIPAHSDDTSVTVTGFNFDPNCTVIMGKVPLTVTAATSTAVTFTVPSIFLTAPTTLRIFVKNPGATIHSNLVNIQVIGQPPAP